MRRIIPAIALAAFAAIVGAPSRPAQAAVVSTNAYQITLTMSLLPLPPPIIPGNPIFPDNAQLTGTVGFVDLPQPGELGHVGHILGGFDITPISFGQTFTTPLPPGITPSPPNIRLGFVFNGALGDFGASAFPDTNNLPNAVPLPPSIFPVGDYVGVPVEFTGPIVAFDDPFVVGTWDITVTPVTLVPEPSTWAMMLIGFAGLGYLAFRPQTITPFA